MKISEYIAKMQKLADKHGDLEVETFFVDGSRRLANGPELAYRKVLTGRQHKPVFWQSHEDPSLKGDKVVCV